MSVELRCALGMAFAVVTATAAALAFHGAVFRPRRRRFVTRSRLSGFVYAGAFLLFSVAFIANCSQRRVNLLFPLAMGLAVIAMNIERRIQPP